ncbi:MAG: carbohydrate ABC transporter permease [Chloroflexi bacterium]|nr:carbohydrate ABC transporter permease [Chloroflexota bacterium]
MRRKSWQRGALLYSATAVLAIWILGPILWAVNASFQTDNELFSVPPQWIPENPTLDNYKYIITKVPPPIYQGGEMGRRAAGDVLMIGRAMQNSVIVASLTALLNLSITVPAAYAFSRMKFIGRNISFGFIMLSRLIPSIALAIPIFIVVKEIGLLDTYPALILVYLAFTLPFTIWFMARYFDHVPPEIEDAALIDGCTRLGALTRIVIPLTLPGIAATGAVAFIFAYSEFLFAVLLTKTMATRTVPVVLTSAAINHDVSYALATTALVLSIIPPIAFALIFRKYITRGLGQAFST